MAGESVIGALRVVLGADTAALDKGLKDSGGKLQAFADVAKASMAVAAAAVGAAAIAIGVSIKTAIDNADKVNKLSQSTGTTTEEFSKLSYAAQLADVSQESLGKSLGKLSKAMVSAASDGASVAGQAFAQMGISVRDADGNLKSSSVVISEVAGKFEGYRDGAAKTALAIALFGKAGAEMIPLLNQGKQGLADASEEAERFGLVLDNKTTMAAEAFNDNLKRMDMIKQGLATTMAAKLLPSLQTLSQALLDSRQESTLWGTVAGWLADQVAKLVTVGVTLITTWQEIFRTAASLKTAISQLATLDFSGAWETMTKSGQATVEAFKGLKDQIQRLWAPDDVDNAMSEMSQHIDAFLSNVKRAGDAMKKDAPWNFDTGEAQKALQAFLDSQSKRIAAMNAEAETVGKSAGEQAKLRLVYEANAIAIAKGIALTPQLTKVINDTGDAAAAAAMKLQGMQLIDQMSTPWDQRAQKVQQYSAAMTAAGASTAQLSMMNMQIQFPNFTAAANAALDFAATLDRLATNSVNMLSSTLADVITGTKSAGEAFAAFAKQVLQQVAQMIVQLLIMKALKMSMGMFFSEGGLVGAPFAKGGVASFAPGGRVNGSGTGTSDSIPAMLSNGEFVINAAAARQIGMPMLNALNSGNVPTFGGGDVSTMPLAPTESRSIQIAGIDPAKWYSGEGVRDLVNALIGAQRDGYSLSPA